MHGVWTPKKDETGSWAVPTAADNDSYNYKALQLDAEVALESDPICNSSGCTQYKHPKKKLGYELNYKVPDFGVDPDVVANHRSLEIAEGQWNHKLSLGTEESKDKYHNPAKDVDYNFKPDLDGDVITTQKNLKNSEVRLGHTYQLAELESDPACSSAGCWKSEYTKKREDKIVQYPDPKVDGLDHDVIVTLNNEKNASGALQHNWNPLKFD